jgi:pSer/pThr/pTyr-binding forkhead associated (FHA) protein
LVGSAHAVINYDGARFEIIDLATKNGTFLNEGGTSVTRQALNNGDLIRVGDTTLQFTRRV